MGIYFASFYVFFLLDLGTVPCGIFVCLKYVMLEESDDTKGLIKIHKSKKDKQYDDQKYKHRSIKHKRCVRDITSYQHKNVMQVFYVYQILDRLQ